MPVIPALGAIASVASAGAAVKGAIDARKAQKEQLALQKEALAQGATGTGGVAGNAQTGQVDIAALDAQIREIARKNAVESMQLEQELTPEVSSLRKQSIQSLQGDLAPDAYDQSLRTGLMSDFLNASPTNLTGRSDLSRAVYDRAAADLALGGELPMDVRNAVLRRSAAQAGRVGGGALDLGRDIGARDLGLTSLDLLNQRMAQAQGVGMQEDQYRLAGDQFRSQELNRVLNQRQNSAGLIGNLDNAEASRRIAIANLAQNIDRPVVGMDPGTAAMLSVGNVNALQAYLANQQALAAQNANASNQATGQILGTLPGAISAIGGLFNKTPSYTAPSYTMPSFNTTLGYTPSVTPTFNSSPTFTTSTGLYGNVTTPSFSYPTSFPAGTCWVARSVYGADNPKWLVWRAWLLTKAPESLRSAYIRTGEKFAAWLEEHPENKAEVRGWMDTILEGEGA